MEKKTKKKATRAVKAQKPPKAKLALSTFQITALEASKVSVAGDFNSWNPEANPMKRNDEGVWKVELRLQPGSYQYKFFIDGIEWREDPLNPDRVSTPFGTFNSVREVV